MEAPALSAALKEELRFDIAAQREREIHLRETCFFPNSRLAIGKASCISSYGLKLKEGATAKLDNKFSPRLQMGSHVVLLFVLSGVKCIPNIPLT